MYHFRSLLIYNFYVKFMKKYIINILIFFLPRSRSFAFKRFLLRWVGYKIDANVRVMRVRVDGVNLRIGENTFIGDDTMICGTTGTTVYIGKNCDISSRVNFVTGTHRLGTIEEVAGEGYGEDIIVEDGVWVGFGAIILPGVKIGKGSIIAAGSVVTRDVASGTMVAGVPAFFKKRIFNDMNKI